jgi:hypothetical protein
VFKTTRFGGGRSLPVIALIGTLGPGVSGCRIPPMTGEALPLNEQLCIEPSQVRIATGRSLTLIAAACAGAPLRLPLTWTSSDSEVASVVGNAERGIVTGLFPGRARIRVTDAEGATASVMARISGGQRRPPNDRLK